MTYLFSAFFLLCSYICFGQSDEAQSVSGFSMYSGFTTFENRIMLLNCDRTGCHNHELFQKTFFQIEAGFDYRLKRLKNFEIGMYYAYNGGSDMFFKATTFLGVRPKYYILPKSLREKTSGIIDVYAIGKAGVGIEHSQYSAINDLVQASIGIGAVVYPVKKIGIYVNYDYSWFDQKSIINQHFIHIGVCVKPKITLHAFR